MKGSQPFVCQLTHAIQGTNRNVHITCYGSHLPTVLPDFRRSSRDIGRASNRPRTFAHADFTPFCRASWPRDRPASTTQQVMLSPASIVCALVCMQTITGLAEAHNSLWTRIPVCIEDARLVVASARMPRGRRTPFHYG